MLVVEMKEVEELRPYEKNAKKHPDDQVAKIADSISKYGFNVPVLIDGSGEIIAGHGRYFAAQKIGLQEVPALVLDNLSKEQARKFRLADNKVAESKWNEALLIEDLEGLKEEGCSVLDVPGFSESDIDKLLNGLQDDVGLGDPDKSPDIEAGHGIVYGDIFALGEHRIICGSATSSEDVTRLLAGERCQVCFTDPPYNVNYKGGVNCPRDGIQNDHMKEMEFYHFMDDVYKNMACALKPGAAFYVCHADSMWKAFREPLVKHGLILKQCLVWVKNQLVLSRSHYHYRHEPILYGHKNGKRVWNGGRHQDSVVYHQVPSIYVEDHGQQKTLYINTDETSVVISVSDYKIEYQNEGMETVWFFSKPTHSGDHPTMKPVDLAKRAIRNSSVAGDSVIDLFLGSGTSLIACEELSRKCYGLEIFPDYCDVVIRRWEEYTGESAQKIEAP